MPDVLLIQPPIRDFYLTAKRTIPYGLACIASALVRDGFSVRILDALANRRTRRIDLLPEMLYLREIYAGQDISPFALFQDFKHFGLGFEEIGEIVGRSGAFLIGISSLFTAYSDEAIQTAESVRRHCPKAVIVLGGHHPTEMPEEVLRHECVDFIIRGEGETALPLLASAIRTGATPDTIPGIGFRTGSHFPMREGLEEGVEDISARVASRNGRIFSSAEIHLNPPVIIENPDNLLPPAIGLIDANFYQRKKKPCAVVVASRGCPLKCTYCSIGGASWSRFRLKSIPAVMEELDQAVFQAGARFIDFEDENISFDKKWFLALLDAIKKKFTGLGLEFRAMNGLFPPTLDEEVIGEMKEAGFTALNLSLCTICREQLDRFRRPDVRASFEKAICAAQKYGIETIGYIIVGAPGQNARDSVADLFYLAAQNVLAGVSVYYPAPGSADFNNCREKSLLPPHLSLMRATALPISQTTTREESATLLRLGRILNFIKSLTSDEIQEVRAAIRWDPAAVQDKIKEICTAGCGGAAATQKIQHGEKRLAAGKLLLSMFLQDGVIRGITAQGNIFNHRASRELSIVFRDGILHQK